MPICIEKGIMKPLTLKHYNTFRGGCQYNKKRNLYFFIKKLKNMYFFTKKNSAKQGGVYKKRTEKSLKKNFICGIIEQEYFVCTRIAEKLQEKLGNA
jgi:hypothetical protein